MISGVWMLLFSAKECELAKLPPQQRLGRRIATLPDGTELSEISWNWMILPYFDIFCLCAVGFQACKDDYKGSSKLAKGTGPLQVHIAKRHAKSRRLRTWSSQRQAPCLKAKNCVFSRYSGIMWHLNLCCLSSSLFSISVSRSPSSSPLYIVVLLPSHSL